MKRGVRGLVPTPSPDRPLTKTQATFRTLLAKVESLRDAIDAEEEELDATLSFYAAEIVPRLARQSEAQKELVRALAPYLNKTFSRAGRNDSSSRISLRTYFMRLHKTRRG
jgi:hypothetical protein